MGNEAMGTVSVWTISGGADLDEVHAFVACAAEKVGMPKPDPSSRKVSVPTVLHDKFVRALSECERTGLTRGWPRQPGTKGALAVRCPVRRATRLARVRIAPPGLTVPTVRA
jgi:hypothetical protein